MHTTEAILTELARQGYRALRGRADVMAFCHRVNRRTEDKHAGVLLAEAVRAEAERWEIKQQVPA